MKSTQFLFFCANIGNEKFLKEEIRLFYPDFHFSYSRKGFLTFKNLGIEYDLKTISQLELTFCTRAGICLGKVAEELLAETLVQKSQEFDIDYEKAIIQQFSINTDIQIDLEILLKRKVNEYAPINKNVFDIMTLGENEIWMGLHRNGKETTAYPNSHVDVILPVNSPSRSYIKLAETFELFPINTSKQEAWLDIGCSPGGSSFFLLEHGHKVWGIDTAMPEKNIMSHPSFTLIKKSIQDLSQEELPFRDIHWIHADLNLNPKQAIKEVLRLSKKYSSRLKGILFTVQMVKIDYIADIEEFEDQFFDWGFTQVRSCQIPGHKSEYLIIAKR